MRKLVLAFLSALALVAVAASPASASTTVPTLGGTSSKLSMTARITSFRATAAGVVANGQLTGKLSSGSKVTRASAPVRFAVATKSTNGQCNVLTLRLAPLDLELLGVQVTTSNISLDVYGLRGEVLGNLFCALAHAKVSLGHAVRAASAMNARLERNPLRVFSTQSVLARPAQTQPQSCQVLNLVLGPLNLNLLGLVVDLYGKTKADPVVVTINAIPSQGLLGQLLCGIAGGSGVSSIASLQNLLNGLGLNLTTTQITNLLNQLGITDLSGGLTQLDLNRILASLGLGSSAPAG